MSYPDGSSGKKHDEGTAVDSDREFKFGAVEYTGAVKPPNGTLVVCII